MKSKEQNLFEIYQDNIGNVAKATVDIKDFSLEERQEFYNILYVTYFNLEDHEIPDIDYDNTWASPWLENEKFNEYLMECNNINDLDLLILDKASEDYNDVCAEQMGVPNIYSFKKPDYDEDLL